ncbi:UDP-N-acetylmuramoyl-L-alanine--D-glutamate ligase [Anaeromyxobacter terrae]|uniref:UDP-N-acetylmuramoyl-L-alanine--D-glutamate ligase n=1 Tax=Anaeromyxobacter terrae TaxID=2925406 RepID=UPI001F577452|nr:UDP-N-acetylmuramoyl-L-alanine--D-glutamate ligase [Anaeromyxobacter sp. SG22]
MSTPDLQGKRVTVVGLAKSGVAAARLCAREGARVTVTDRRGPEQLAAPLAALAGASVRRALGGHDPADFERADLVVVSPGVPMAIPELRAARAAGVPVWGEAELAAHFLPGVPIVAITGTNGKSTTTALAGALFARHRPTFTGGNLGTPLCEHVLQGGGAEVVVLELSSFQIEGLLSLRPRVAAILNVTPDHLDRYRDVEDYAAAKARLFALQQAGDHAVANARDPRALAMAEASRATLHTFGFGPPVPDGARDPGGEPGAGGATEVWVRRGGGAPERYRLANRALRGRHNRENAMAAVLCARLLGVPGDAVQAGLEAFPGLPHRLELVSERGGVEWVNDSKATNVDSTFVGLSAFPAGTPRVVLVMGGRGKGAPYAPLRPLFPGRVKALLTVGEDAPAVERELGDLCPTEACGTLAGAVRRAAVLARPGDAVLLSPACASYDQFRNYEERGDAFRSHVAELA